MIVRMVTGHPEYETAKADGRARRNKRGVRKGRHMVRARVVPGAPSPSWMASEAIPGMAVMAVGLAKTRAGAIRECRSQRARLITDLEIYRSKHAFLLAP